MLPAYIIAVVAMTCMSGCTQGVVTFTGGSSSLRVFNAQTKTALMNVEIDSVVRFSNIRNGDLTDAVNVSSGVFHLFRCRSSSDTGISGLIVSQRYMMGDGASYTMVVRGSGITDFIKPILDSTRSPFAGRAALRIINATDTSYCDVYVNNVKINGIVAEAQSASRLYAVDAGQTVYQVRDHYNDTVIHTDTLSLTPDACYHMFVYDATTGTGTRRAVKTILLNN